MAKQLDKKHDVLNENVSVLFQEVDLILLKLGNDLCREQVLLQIIHLLLQNSLVKVFTKSKSSDK